MIYFECHSCYLRHRILIKHCPLSTARSRIQTSRKIDETILLKPSPIPYQCSYFWSMALALSPTRTSLASSLVARRALMALTTLEWIDPQRPLSEVNAMIISVSSSSFMLKFLVRAAREIMFITMVKLLYSIYKQDQIYETTSTTLQPTCPHSTHFSFFYFIIA